MIPIQTKHLYKGLSKPNIFIKKSTIQTKHIKWYLSEPTTHKRELSKPNKFKRDLSKLNIHYIGLSKPNIYTKDYPNQTYVYVRMKLNNRNF